MDEAAGADGAVGVPETAVKGVLVANGFSPLEYLSPGHRHHVPGRDVERRNLVLQVGPGIRSPVQPVQVNI